MMNGNNGISLLRIIISPEEPPETRFMFFDLKL